MNKKVYQSICYERKASCGVLGDVIGGDCGKCLVRVGTEQTIANNDTTVVYLAKSLSINDYEEKQPIEATNDSILI